VYGDPHYYTYDGIRIDYQGECRYVASKTCDDNTHFNFTVIIKQEKRYYGRYKFFGDRVTFIEYVDIYIDDVNIRLLKNGGLEVDGGTQYVPYLALTGSGVPYTVYSDKEGIAVLTNEFQVWYEGDWHATITVNRAMFGGKLCGLCADCDSDPNNDLITSDLVDLAPRTDLTLAEKHAYLGNSWQVPADDELGLG